MAITHKLLCKFCNRRDEDQITVVTRDTECKTSIECSIAAEIWTQDRLTKLKETILGVNDSLEDLIRESRQLSILAPFKKDTRVLLFNALQDNAAEIAKLRVEVQRLECLRSIVSDLLSQACDDSAAISESQLAS